MRKLQLLLIDDDSPEGCIKSILYALDACLSRENYEIDYPTERNENHELAAYFFGQKCLQRSRDYDFILLDLKLEGDDHEWGGIELLDTYWQKIQAARSKVLIYSGKPDAVTAFKWFGSGKGPFLFHSKAGERDIGDSFTDQVIRLLRDRVRSLCQRASLRSALSIAKCQSDEEIKESSIEIDGEDWNVGSLLAPWLCKLSGESERQTQAVIRTLFPSDDLIRVFSYWFKGKAFVWPSNPMFGLTPLAPYHIGGNPGTGSMEALTHAHNLGFTKQFAEAAVAALNDLNSLSGGLNYSFKAFLNSYIEDAKTWEKCDTNKATECKKQVMFKVKDITSLFG